MTKADLVEKVTATIARTAGPMISKKDCAIRKRKTRMARNPRTGDPVEVAARPVPVFKPSKELRAMVAEATERVPQA
ncbi:MAG: HU family DNA-binding protein [Gemmatimonadetes bacterium]|nr:HU family DNA-binding protein [Gemmatimonadota bacterium]